jgi:DnaJ-class molecular chaperone
MDTEKSHPVGYCTGCRRTTYNATDINKPCRRTIGGKKCKGTIRSALYEGDWQKCEACQGTGFSNNVHCSVCGGDGWLLARHPA